MIQFFPNEQTFILFRIGSFTLDIRWYAVLIMCGALLAYHFSKQAFREAKYRDSDFLDSLFIYYNLDCKYCDMRIKNHARPCENHKVGIPTKIVYDAEKD